MSERVAVWESGWAWRTALLLMFGLSEWIGVSQSGTRAAEIGTPPPGLDPRVPVDKCVSPTGTLLSNARTGLGWQAMGPDATVYSRDLVMALPGVRALLEPRPQSVQVTLWGNMPELSPFPGFQSEIVLYDTRALDLDFALQRGRVVLTNRKVKGPAQVWVRLPRAAWQLTLRDSGAEGALEIYGRWPPGVPFSRIPHSGKSPPRSSR